MLFFEGKEETPSLGKFQPTEARSLHHFPHRWAGGSSWERRVGPGQPWADLTVGLETDMTCGWGRAGWGLSPVSQAGQVMRGRQAPGLERRPAQESTLCTEPRRDRSPTGSQRPSPPLCSAGESWHGAWEEKRAQDPERWAAGLGDVHSRLQATGHSSRGSQTQREGVRY